MANLSFDEFLDRLRKQANSTVRQGQHFERAMVALLPKLNDWQFAEAWLWADWPHRFDVTGQNAQDTGIDIIARIKNSSDYWAIQCKFYDEEATISHGDLGTFYTASGKEWCSGRLIITTTDKWTGHAEQAAEGQMIEAHRLRLQDLQKLDISWNWLRPDKTTIRPPKKKTLWAKQQEAFDAAKTHYETHDRGKLIMACGTGKTFTSLKIAEEITPPRGKILFVVPSLSLMRQTISEWAWQRGRDHKYIGICSDRTVGKTDEEDNTQTADLTVPVTTDAHSILRHLNAEWPKHPDRPVAHDDGDLDAPGLDAADHHGQGNPADAPGLDAADQVDRAGPADPGPASPGLDVADQVDRAGPASPGPATPALDAHDDIDLLAPDLASPASQNLKKSQDQGPQLDDRMLVVFCTYQSLDRLSLAQDMGGSGFDLIICDEAHRTTGVDKGGDKGGDQKNSNFVRIHDQEFIRGEKRLYMTATPRIYTDSARKKADEMNIGIYSMDNSDHYGKDFYRLGFSAAVNADMLADYRVIVLNISQEYVHKQISKFDETTIKEIDASTDDVAKIIGCYKALRDQGEGDKGIKLKRAVSFSNTIKNSKMVQAKFTKVVEELDDIQNDGFTCEVQHVDGSESSLKRAKKLDWLRASPPPNSPPNPHGEVCRILSNARCLTEGVDVPSLDAVLFMNPRKSQVDVVQAVGRVMRRAAGKDYGYVILPVVIPEGVDIEDALNKNETYHVVWEVLRALRAHDDRLTSMISKLELNENKPDNISVIGIGFSDDAGEGDTVIADAAAQLKMQFPEEWAQMIYAKIVDKVGDKLYLEHWAKDTAILHGRLVSRIDALRAEKPQVATIYEGFLASLRSQINDGLGDDQASSMLAQQLITRPVFDALFKDYQFSENNVVSAALDNVLAQLEALGLGKELEKLQGFYESVENRILGLDNDEARQSVITELYEKFFTTAFPKTAESLGIAYTPIELVDFTLRSADEVMRAEFGRGLTDKGVHIIDPFTGTGSFLVRLLNDSNLIKDKDLQRKFDSELWANEILLLAYYIASVNIEMAFHQRGARAYKPFPNISLTDTFELFEKQDVAFPAFLGDNNDRLEKQRQAPIRVVVGNPPWSVGQKSGNDGNDKRLYEGLDNSIRETYADRSKATLKRNLYDSYVRAIRWASDRIGEEGVIAFVTPYGWLDRSFADGMRLCLEEEFDAIWLFDLRGDIRKNIASKGATQEGGSVFGQKTQNGVYISLLIKNPAKKRERAKIHYHNIGDNLSQKAKLEIITKAQAVSGLDWRIITPNAEGDWLNQRDPMFQTFMEMGNDQVKKGKVSQPQTIFRSYSLGLVTSRDAWAGNFSHEAVSLNMKRMIANYNEECHKLTHARKQNPNIDPDRILDLNPTRISWDRGLKSHAVKGHKGTFKNEHIYASLYRPFTLGYLYFDRQFNNCVYKQPTYFPTANSENRLICVTGVGAKCEFSCLITDKIPNLHTLDTGQTFPRWTYRAGEQGKFEREDNITAHALKQFQTHYKDETITKDDIFDYIYGILHAPDYRERFATDLRLSLPRIPLSATFWPFAQAGKTLAKLHLGWPLNGPAHAKYELGKLLNEKPIFSEMIPEIDYKVNKMTWRTRPEGKFIKYNEKLTIGPIPPKALTYTIGNTTPIDWIIARYQFKKDKASEIINDPNDWIKEQDSPDALVRLMERVVYLSIETAQIIEGLPKGVGDAK